MTQRELEEGRREYPEDTRPLRPKTRGECENGERPCPFVSCRYHLYLDVLPSGNIRLAFPDLELEDLQETCALDVADRGGLSLEETARANNVTRVRIQQIEAHAFNKLKPRTKKLQGILEESPNPWHWAGKTHDE